VEIALTNRGQQGESAVDGQDRLVSEVQSAQPEVLLLLEGTNDVNKGTPLSTIVAALRADVNRAFRYGAKVVFLSTLPPEVPGRFRAANPDGVIALNDMIRDAAAREGAIFVDAYSALAPQQQLLIGDDGLHPTVQGYRVLADTFVAAIEANLELVSAPASLFNRPLAGSRPAGSSFVPPGPTWRGLRPGAK
jgi:lysophospholipase L1-like esterase